jgi:gliding motility-associated-like protein
MRKTAFVAVLCVIACLNLRSQYADLGTGSLKSQIWWFDWNGFTISNGASRVFNTADGLTVTITFSNVQGPVCQPNVMNTWYGSVLHLLYNFSNTSIKPALLSPYSTTNSQFTITVSATRGGSPTPFKFVAADAEATAFGESTSLTTTGSNWLCIDFFRNSSQTNNPFAGCNTSTAVISNTYSGTAGSGQNPVLATDAPVSGSLTLNCTLNRNSVEGQSAMAFGIFAPVDRGDLPASYGTAYHKLSYTTANPCNFLPPLPTTTLTQQLKIGSTAGDADPPQISDDNTVGADEDGLSGFPQYNNSGSYSLILPVSNTTGNDAYLTGWLDINRNGSFETNEFATTTVANNATTATVTWSGLPATFPPGATTYHGIRFRFSSNLAATQSPTGYAADGEVEDYYEDIIQRTTSANFVLPDSVCVGQPVNIENTTPDGTTYYWNFCSGSLNSAPVWNNFSSANLSMPVFMDIVQDGPNYYVFVVNHSGSLSRMDYGNSLLNTPTITNLGSFGGIIPWQAEGIEIQRDGSNWIGYLIGGQYAASRLVKLNFGSTVANTPTATNLGNIGGIDFPVDFTLIKDGTNWYGFTVNADNNTITRYNFGNSLNNVPVATNLGNVGNLSYPVGLFLLKDGANYHAFVTNRNSHSITRLDFGTSPANSPVGTNLGNIGGRFTLPRDITVIRDCDRIFGFVVNEANKITRLDFTTLTSIPVATDLFNLGNLNFPSCISEVFRTGDAVNFFCPNVNSNSISKLTFNNCTSSSIPSYIGTTPPPFQYSQPGVYNVSLFVDEGMATKSVLCKQIIVKDCGRELSGVVNDYTEITGFDPCKNALSVTNAGAFNIGDTVLMIQMKGAVIDTTNTAAFGTITDYKSAGNYEFNYVKSKTGNSIELKNALTRTFDIPDGVVQLIRVPYYKKAVVSSEITCLPWDGAKGGVVVFNVEDTLTVNANISVIGKGFRGGIDPFSNPAAANCNENQYYYPPNPDLASGKGEGIANISVEKSFGKGALASGGGGGNSHNSGGGGGGNGAGGGFGGYNFERAPCNTGAPFDNRGIGGKPLLYSNTANKIFMGGGGGAGHTNNPEGFQAMGGNGGGIVIISANVVRGNSASVRAIGNNAPACSGLGATGCHEGMGGGGAAGTVLFNINTYLGGLNCNIKGGSGGSVSSTTDAGKVGPGGGGSSGIVWFKGSSAPPSTIMSVASAGGQAGENQFYFGEPGGMAGWGASNGGNTNLMYDLNLPVANIPFKPNIDSVRIKDSLTTCKSFDFKGRGFTNTNPIADWQWYFGDGGTATTQNSSHVYINGGTYTVKLVVTDINGCKDSIIKQVTTAAQALDFTYQSNACSPFVLQFNGLGSGTQSAYWSFGDATFATGDLNPVHTYPGQNTYTVKYSAGDGVCFDTVTKTINLFILPDDIITKQLRTKSSLSFCWFPTTYLDNPNSPNPITSTPQNITYYYTAQVPGNNLIVNGDFSQGNTGFTSQYQYQPSSGVLPAVYTVRPDILPWHPTMSNCHDHTTGSGNMMLVNGADVPNVEVWSQTIAVTPNTNYEFAAWLQHITNINPATLQFSINGISLGSPFQANNTSCLWEKFFTTWQSGTVTSATISIININQLATGNDFALDDISFSPVLNKTDSVIITVDQPDIETTANTSVCEGTPVQFNTTGATNYIWTPTTGLSSSIIGNPIANPVNSTTYYVSGTNSNGCIAKDTVDITVFSKPTITTSENDTVCKNTPVQLLASGGSTYSWTPDVTLSDPSVPDPIANPTVNTIYYVTVTDDNNCSNIDSIKIDIRPDPVFAINPSASMCEKKSVQLNASGGDLYSWLPITALSNTTTNNPVASPTITTLYTVTIQDTVCHTSKDLSTTVTVLSLPNVQASKSNDIDCSNDFSQLVATGAASYEWVPSTGLDNNMANAPVARPDIATSYAVKGTDINGCVNYDTVLVNISADNKSGYLMPTAFTPNNDGLNDCYGIKLWGVIMELEFSVYNRWGERIFFTKDPNSCWDGRYKGVAQDAGVYVYMIKAKTFCSDTFKKGLFTLIR